MTETALRMSMVWNDEVMGDFVALDRQKFTIGARATREAPPLWLLLAGLYWYFRAWLRSTLPTFVIPDLGLPAKFVLARPGGRGYVLTLGERMRGTLCIDGIQRQVGEVFRASEGSGSFRAVMISGRDWGLVELDESGRYKVFFQFVAAEDPHRLGIGPISRPLTPTFLILTIVGYMASFFVLTFLLGLLGMKISMAMSVSVAVDTLIWWLALKDGPLQASFSFSLLLHLALLIMTYQLYDPEDPFTWPGPRALSGTYLATHIDKEEPPEVKPPPTVGKQQTEAAAPQTKEPPKKTATKGEEGRQGGKGETERARDPNAKEPPAPPPKVAMLEDKNRKVLDNIIDHDLSSSLSKFNGIKGDTLTRGSLGYGTGTGTGVGIGEGTGTRGGSKKGGSGGGGNAEGDFVTGPGKIDTGGNRPGGGTCKGTNCGTGPVGPGKLDLAPPNGDFGGLTAEEIDRVIKLRAGLFRQCYQKELNRTPGIGGKLVIHFKIGGDGNVQAGSTATASSSSLHNDGVESCVKRNINNLKFPAKGGIANVNYPFVFSQGG